MQEMAPSNLGRVFGRILLVRVSEDALVDRDRQHVDADKLDLIGRTEGGWQTPKTGRSNAEYSAGRVAVR